MKSFRMVYDAEGDILDVDFRLAGEKPKRGLELHDNIVLWTDAKNSRAIRLMFISYTKLLGRKEIILNGLKNLSLPQRRKLLKIVTQSPVDEFVSCIDRQRLRFKILEADLKQMVKAA